MPDLPVAERGRLLAAGVRAAWAVDNAFRSTLGAAAAVVVVAAALQLSGIRPEYVAAAAVVVFIRRFADKRYGSNIRVEQPPAKERTYKHEDVAALDALQQVKGPARPGRHHIFAVWRTVSGPGKGDKPTPVEWWCVMCRQRFTKRRGNGHCPVMSQYA